MGDCSTNCNPCGPSYDAINQLATQTKSYARQANTSAVDAANSATNAENSWLEFNALYLGSFAAAPTTDNEGNPLQEGALYFNSVSNQMFVWQGGSWIDFDFDEFTPFLATGSTNARNLVTRTADVANVLDFGADPTGVADSSTAFQNALNLLNSRQNGGMLLVPAGNYLVNTTLTYSNKSLAFIGVGIGLTIIKKSTGTDLFVYNGSKISGTVKADFLTVDGIEFVAAKIGSGVGSAIKAIWPENMTARACCSISNVSFQPLDGNGATYWWDNSIYLQNAAQSNLTNIRSRAVNSNIQTHIRLDYSNNPSSYAILMDRLYFQGGLYGIHQTGCVEMVMISKGEIVGSRIGVFMDSSASLIPTNPVGYNPLLEVKDIHINSKEWNIKAIQWEAINISGVEFFHGVGSGTDVDGGNVFIDNPNDPTPTKGRHRIINNKFQSPLSLPISDIGLRIRGVGRAIVSGNLFLRNSQMNIWLENSNQISVLGNSFYPGFNITQNILIENTLSPIQDSSKIRISGNVFEQSIRGIVVNDGVSDIDIFGNTFDDVSVPVLLDNPRQYGQQVAIQGNKSIAWERKLLTNNSATPSVSGAQEGLCYHANSSATTITDFVDGYASQTIDIESNNGNTTIQHNANIRLQGGVDFTMAAGNRLYLRKEDSSSGSSWYEIGRLT